ncbi:MAG: DUF2721 domain-containing protein [Pseudomonadota bacterium]
MTSFELYALSFTLVPGVGLLIVSTANRFHHVNSLIRSVVSGSSPLNRDSILPTLVTRSHRLQLALVALYAAVAAFVVSGLVAQLGRIADVDAALVDQAPLWTLTAGVTAVLLAVLLLILESRLAFKWVHAFAKDATTDSR